MKTERQRRPAADATPDRDLFFNIINRFVGLFTSESNRTTRNDPASEYPFVAMDTRQVYAQLCFAKKYLGLPDEAGDAPRPTLLDIGCGIGNVLLFAEQLGFEVYGIEKDPYPCSIARRLFGEKRVGQHDIWSYGRYNDFDVLYYFRPFSDREPQRRFEAMIDDRLKPGGLLIANHRSSDDIDRDPRFVRLSPRLPIWAKKPA
jgi:SAM-dependent methyltransferase